MTKDEFVSKIMEYENALYMYGLKLMKDKERARDLTQEVLYKALKYFELFKENTNLKGWLFVLMKNEFINNYRKNKLKQKKHDDFYNVRVQQIFDTNLPTPTSTLELKEIYGAISTLKSTHRQCFLLHVEGYQYEEIAKILEIPLGTVKSRIFIARQSLMEILKK